MWMLTNSKFQTKTKVAAALLSLSLTVALTAPALAAGLFAGITAVEVVPGANNQQELHLQADMPFNYSIQRLNENQVAVTLINARISNTLITPDGMLMMQPNGVVQIGTLREDANGQQELVLNGPGLGNQNLAIVGSQGSVDIANALETSVSELTAPVNNAATNAVSGLNNSVNNVVSRASNTASNAVNAVNSTTSSVVDNASSAVEASHNTAVSAGQQAKQLFTPPAVEIIRAPALPSIPEPMSTVPTVPALQSNAAAQANAVANTAANATASATEDAINALTINEGIRYNNNSPYGKVTPTIQKQTKRRFWVYHDPTLINQRDQRIAYVDGRRHYQNRAERRAGKSFENGKPLVYMPSMNEYDQRPARIVVETDKGGMVPYTRKVDGAPIYRTIDPVMTVRNAPTTSPVPASDVMDARAVEVNSNNIPEPQSMMPQRQANQRDSSMSGEAYLNLMMQDDVNGSTVPRLVAPQQSRLQQAPAQMNSQAQAQYQSAQANANAQAEAYQLNATAAGNSVNIAPSYRGPQIQSVVGGAQSYQMPVQQEPARQYVPFLHGQ